MNNLKIRPLHNNLIVKALSEETSTLAGIVLPDTVDKERPEKGEVLAAGPGKLLDNGTRAPMEVKVGDKIMFKKYSPDEIKLEKEEYLIIAESDILAILE